MAASLQRGEGPEGLKHWYGAGRPRWLSAEQMEEFSQIVETAPDQAVDGVVRWRRVIEECFAVRYSERAISNLLAALTFLRISGRAQHPKQDEWVIEAFKKTSPVR